MSQPPPALYSSAHEAHSFALACQLSLVLAAGQPQFCGRNASLESVFTMCDNEAALNRLEKLSEA
jgi:hypothetical protein